MRWQYINNNNNINEYFVERPTSTGPKRLHVLYKYILSKFNIQHECTHTRTHTHTRTRTAARAHTHTVTLSLLHTHTHTHTNQSHIRANWQGKHWTEESLDSIQRERWLTAMATRQAPGGQPRVPAGTSSWERWSTTGWGGLAANVDACFCRHSDTYPSYYNKNIWPAPFLLVCFIAMEFAPFWHPSHSVLSESPTFQNCFKTHLYKQ